MRGLILSFDAETGGGLISGDDGNRYAFSAMDVRGDLPAVGASVDFVPAEGYAREVIALAVPAPAATPSYAPAVRQDYTGEDLSLWDYFVRAVTSHYAQGSGRARRKEFWGFALFSNLFAFAPILIGLIAAAVTDPSMESDAAMVMFGTGFAVFGLLMMAMLIPSICVYVRRLHDVGMSGWLYLLGLVPFGNVFLLVVSLMPSQQQTNQYGPIPTPRPPSAI